MSWVVAMLSASLAMAPRQTQEEPRTLLSEQIELPRLLDLCAERLELNIQYDANEVRGAMTLRLGAGVDDDQLWALTNRLLAARGMTSVQMPGEGTLSVVRLDQAANLARIETEGLDASVAGFVKILHTLEHRTPEEVLPAVTLVLSRPGGFASALGKGNRLVLADRRPQLEQIVEILDVIDVPPGESILEEVPVRNLTPQGLVQAVTEVVSARTAVLGESLRGQLLPLDGGRGVLLMSPLSEGPTWRSLIDLLDRPEGLETVTYTPVGFPVADIARLVEETVAPPSGRASPSGWRLVSDALTGSLIVTATTSQHAEIAALIQRLESVPRQDVVIEEVAAEHVEPTQLVSLVERVAEGRASVVGKPLQGRLLPAPGGAGILLIAPPAELELWRELVASLDRVEAPETVSYTTRSHGVREVAALIEEVVRGSGEGWRVVPEELTQTLVVTATPSEHRRIAELLARLEAERPAGRASVRSFVVRNRSAEEIETILERLIGPGAAGPRGAERSRRTGLPDRQINRAEPRVQPPAPGPSASSQQRGAQAASLLGEEAFSMTADPATNSLVAIGEPAFLEQLEGLIASLDERQPQVMVEVLVIALTDSLARDLGVELEALVPQGDTFVQLSSLFGLGSGDLVAGIPPTPGTGFSGIVLDPGDFSALVRALEVLNQGRTLTMPKLLVNNNQQALLDSVLQTPFTSTNASDTVATTSFGGTLDAGTSLTITPQIAEGDHLVLEYTVSLSQFTGDSADPNLPPPRQQNSLQSTVTIPDGYTVALGGLELESDTEAVSEVPWLGRIPLLGRLFQSSSKTASRSRLFVFIRANVLRQDTFEDLRFLSERELDAAGAGDGWPRPEPRPIW